MKRSDLFREYARVVDMCEPQKINPAKCVKQHSWADFEITPEFCDLIESYTFAIGICEGKPVFAGDVLYWNKTGFELRINSIDGCGNLKDSSGNSFRIDDASWTKPDPYAELKKALDEGKVIQFLCGSVWADLVEEEMTLYKVDFLRIKPDPVVAINNIKLYCPHVSADKPAHVKCTWTDGVLTNVEIVK